MFAAPEPQRYAMLNTSLRVTNMKNQLESDKKQLSVSTIRAFDIQICSRYSNASEMIEMLNFANKTAHAKLSHLVNAILYDSKANICTFELSDKLKQGSIEEQTLLRIAKSTISQFIWFGTIYHGDFADV